MDERGADILEQCLARLEAGASVEECLAAFPQQRAVLEGPLRAAAQLRGNPWPGMPAPARAAIEARVTSRLATMRSATTALPAPTRPPAPPRALPDPAAFLGGLLRALGYRGALPQPWLRPAALVLAGVLALALSAGAFAAARAIVRTLAPEPRPTPAPISAAERFDLAGVVQQIGPGEWLVEGLPVTVDSQTAITGSPAVGASASVSGVIAPDGALLARTIALTGGAPDVAPQPTAAPTDTQPTPPPAEPTAAPAPAPVSTPLATLRILIETGVADGRIGKEGDDLLKKVDETERALAEGKLDKVADQLRDIAKRVVELVREGKMDVGLGEEIILAVVAVAESRGIPVVIEHGGNNGNNGNNGGGGNNGNNGNNGGGGNSGNSGGDDDDEDGGDD
ncbi:MAG: hypothetical protein RLZZ387_2825 [Chloroflexota bacterium]